MGMRVKFLNFKLDSVFTWHELRCPQLFDSNDFAPEFLLALENVNSY